MNNNNKLSKTQISKKRYRHSEKGYKTHRIEQWKNKYGILLIVTIVTVNYKVFN